MSRDEEIKKAEIKYSNDTLFDGCDYVGQFAKQEAFIAGAKWADEHPQKDLVNINKVIDWLRDNFTTKYDDYEALVDFNHLLKEFCEEVK